MEISCSDQGSTNPLVLDAATERVEIQAEQENLISDCITAVICAVVDSLHNEQMPLLSSNVEEASKSDQTRRSVTCIKSFQYHQCRSFTSVLMVLDFCHAMLDSNRTTTLREVYYHYVTHFRSQEECNRAIQDAANLLGVPRHLLGVVASPRGWYCGDLQLLDASGNITWDGRFLQSVHGAPIGSEWLQQAHIAVQTCAAICILVIEKEGVYNRLVEDRFFDEYPCILVTGKGFPDMASRALVHFLHHALGKLPVWGLADGNPYGSLVLNTYHFSQRRDCDGGHRYSVPIQWIGLRSDQLLRWRNDCSGRRLPSAVFQSLTEVDRRRLLALLSSDHCWTSFGRNHMRVAVLEKMLSTGYKMELEALNWLGMDYLTRWLGRVFDYNIQRQAHFISATEDEETHESSWLEIL